MLSRLFRLSFLWRIADHIHEIDIKVNKLINIKVVLTGKIRFLLSSLFKYTLISDGKPISGSPITIRRTEKYREKIMFHDILWLHIRYLKNILYEIKETFTYSYCCTSDWSHCIHTMRPVDCHQKLWKYNYIPEISCQYPKAINICSGS